MMKGQIEKLREQRKIRKKEKYARPLWNEITEKQQQIRLNNSIGRDKAKDIGKGKRKEIKKIPRQGQIIQTK